MKMMLVRLAAVAALAGLAVPALGCSYAGATSSGDNAVILRNDMLLFGMLRQAFVCKVTENGLSGCKAQENP